MSRREAESLSDRLRASDPPSESDMVLLAELLLEHNATLGEVSAKLTSAGYQATTRLKTSGTIIEKLRRMPELHLRSIRDLAGARIVRPMSLDEQDAVTEEIRSLWPADTTKVIDRRQTPSHGYRAVHIVPRIEKCSVEIQLRTLYQDTWAQAMESIGDTWGRAIRYGGEPDDPDAPSVGPASLTRSQVVQAWKLVGDSLFELAQVENRIARLMNGTAVGETATQEELQAQVDTQFGDVKALERNFRGIFASRTGG
jgi:Region found in RelA / SpoT proteins